MKKVFVAADYTHYVGHETYEFPLDADAAEVRLSLEFRCCECVSLYLARPDDTLVLVEHDRVITRDLRCVGFDRMIVSTADAECDVAGRVVVLRGKRFDWLDPTPVTLVPPDRDTGDISRMIAAGIRAAVAARFGDDDRRFHDPDNDLSFSDDLDDEATPFMERDDDFGDGAVDIRGGERRDAPPKKKAVKNEPNNPGGSEGAGNDGDSVSDGSGSD